MSTNSAVTSSADTSSSDKYTGRVKWFNTKAGYGFVTITDGPKSGNDVFVHHSAIKVDSEQYRYLVQGEYVEFKLSSVSGGNHEYQADEVSGIKGGKLMCETRRDVRTSRSQYRSSKPDVAEDVKTFQKARRGQAPIKQTSDGDGDWQPAKKSKPAHSQPMPSRSPVGPPPARPAGDTPRAPRATRRTKKPVA